MGYEGRYQVSNLGRIQSFVHSKAHILKQYDRRGYLAVTLVDSNHKIGYLAVHRLVIVTFKGHLKGKNQVNHKNGVKTDNRIDNLEWVTGSENMIHAYKHGLEKPCDNGLKKQVLLLKNGKVIKEFISIHDMCRKMNLDRRSVLRVIKGEYSHHHGFTFLIK